MFFCLVVLLSLSWPHVIGTGNTHPRDEAAFDQIATASENVAQNAEKPEQKPEFRNQLITSMIDTTVHYENSNGFVPILVSSSPSPSDPFKQPDATSLRKEKESINVTRNNFLNERVNPANTGSTNEQTAPHETDNLEDDPVYSTEARIFLNFPNLSANRRSFEYQGDQNNFELLKVRNDTPVVATYTDLYEEALGINENGDEKTRSMSRHKTQGNRQKVEDYMGNYGTIVSENNSEDDSHSYYYSHNSAKDTGKKSRDQEKVGNNYQQQNVLSYDGHGQSAARQNEPAASSFPRLNDEVSVFLKTNAKNDGDSYSIAHSSPQIPKNHKFFHPVVVAEPNYKFHQPSSISAFDTDNHQTSRIIDSVSSEVSHRYTMNNRDGRFRSDEDSRDVSDEGDYAEYTERPRRVQKSRRRPSNSSKRLPKEHRGNLDSAEQESQGKRHHSSRSKSHRQKVRGNSWADDDRHQDQDDSYEDARYDGKFSASETRHVKSQKSNFKPSSSWNQISPNLEISHSSGIEIGQLEKPKLIVPVKVNLVPVANFDHATAIGNSQGFDVSNAILHNIVSATPLNAVSTSAPEISTGENVIGNDVKIRVSTPLPDIIVGQNNFHNSMHANLKPQYVSNTVAPVFAVTPTLNHNLQSISAQDAQGTATSRPAVVTTSNQMSANHMPQLILPQPTFQTIPTLMQTPVVIGSDYIQVNPHGIHGQNPISQGNLQVQPLPTMPTITPTPQTIPVTKINLITSESQNKKTMLPGTSTNFLASASFAVGHDDQGQTFNGNPYYLENSNSQGVKPQVQDSLYQQSLKNINVAPKTKTYLQTTHLLPAVFNPVPTFTTLSASTPQIFSEQQNIQGTNFLLQQSRDQGQQYLRQNTGFDNGASTLKNIKVPSLAYQMIDNTASHNTDNINTLNASPSVSGIIGNAHLPHVGTRNVEIVNPNIKSNPIDTTIINSYESMNYPTAVLTTSIPMFSTTSFVTAKPAILSTTESTNVQNVMNAFTDVGSNNNQGIGNDLKAYQSQDKPMFNPINFVPNMDVVKNQNALNNKQHANEPLQQNLNLVPLLPGGNFFKPSFSAQSELLVKPKLTLDLKTYAEQMFKESLKTIYNSQKWNNDRKPGNNRNNATDLSDIAKLKNELQRLKASLFDSRQNKDQLEAHHSETKVRTTELPGKKPDEMIAALEQMLKKNPKNSLLSSYGNNKPYRQRRPQDQDKYNFGSNNDFRDTKHVRDFLTPPQLNSHRTKGHLRGKPGKKRPGPSRFNNHNNNHKHNHHHGPRSHSRSNLSHKSANIDSSGSNIDPVHTDGSPKHDNTQDSKQFRKGSPFDSHASPSTLSRDTINFPKASKQHKDGKENAYNHPKVHNFLGLLMKNKQLPNGATPNYFRDKNQLNKFFENEKMRTQQQFYDDTLRDYYQKVTDGMLYSNLGQTDSSARRSLSEKRTV